MNKRVLVCSAWVASMGAGCVQYAAQPTYARVTIAAAMPPQQTSGGVAYNAADVPDVPSVPGQRVDAATIRRTLTGAGSWAEDETYGMVWYPSVELVGGQFAPYGTHGHWVLTDAGWYWQSELRWGWLTFHYGRWVVIREQWAWVPGAMFAPAWVDWRIGGGYVGWAPLPPQGAVFTAPYMFCGYDTLYMQTGLWSRLVYGPAAASIYATTTAVPTSYGYGGAVYAWGPTPVPVRVSDPARSGPPALVPIASAWGTETRGNPRSGTPADATTSGSAGRPVGASSSNSIAATNVNVPAPRITNVTPTNSDAIAATNVNVPSPHVTPITTSNAIAAPSVNVPSAGPPRAGQVAADAWSADSSHAFAASAAATAVTAGTPNQPGAWVNAPASETGRTARMRDVEPAVAQPDTTTVYVDTSVVGPGRYRTADTVTLGSQVTSAPIRRPTISLGTTGGGYSDGFDSGYEAPVATAAPAATSVPSVSGGGYAPPPSMPAGYAPAPAYAPSGYASSGYVQPSYGAAVMPSAAGGAYVPSYAAPSPSVPVAVPSPSFNGYGGYGGSAPVVRAPSYSAPINAGGSFAPVHTTVAPIHTSPIAPVMAAPPSIGPSVGPTFRR